MMKKQTEYLEKEGTLATAYEATACTFVKMSSDTIEKITAGQMLEGDVLSRARAAGLRATKKSHEILPSLPPLADDAVKVNLIVKSANQVDISVTATSTTRDNANKASVMIASMTALSLYNLCNGVDQGLEIGNVTSYKERKIA